MSMSKRRTTTLAAILLCGLLLAPSIVEGLTDTAAANGTPTIDWHVIGGGGGHALGGVSTLNGTIGQPTAGTVADTDLELCSGFWCRMARGSRVYLPLMMQDN
jgi:hypothetical protein